ncbi:hypothetical protein DW640_02800 [Bacteroides sp. AM23-12]|nr:hypothetical protein DW640_02800 [Bacteroides sp. AM23-12]
MYSSTCRKITERYEWYTTKGTRLTSIQRRLQHKEYIPIEGEYADVESLKGTMLDWEELTRVSESWQGNHASIPLLVDIIYNSSTMSFPFYRKMVAYMEDGFKTSRQTLINWMSKVGDYLKNVLLHLSSSKGCHSEL